MLLHQWVSFSLRKPVTTSGLSLCVLFGLHFRYSITFICMYVCVCGLSFCLCVCLSDMCAGTDRGQKRVSGPLEPITGGCELLILGTGNQTRVLRGAGTADPSPQSLIFRQPFSSSFVISIQIFLFCLLFPFSCDVL